MLARSLVHFLDVFFARTGGRMDTVQAPAGCKLMIVFFCREVW
jgi:hypothetical protein